ncbi:MAG: DUF349 domain-containing protein [Bacteroidales bacterium]|nr:DUF349 domain-containing protein [Bacteroidales bacterium]
MENQELLHPEDAEMQNQEVNSGASMEAQETMSQETPASEVEPVVAEEPAATEPVTEAPAAAEEAVVEPAPETAEAAPEVVEPAPEAVEAAPEVVESAPEQPAPESPASPEEMMAEMDQQQAATESVTETETEEPAPEETLEQVEAEYAGFDLEQCVAELERLVKEPNFNLIKMRVGVLRARIIEFFRERKRAAQQAFEAAKTAAAAAAAENPEAPAEEVEIPSNEPDEIETRFNKAFQQYKDSKAKFIEALEAQKQDNLNAKNKIIDGLSNLIETESNLKVLNDKFKEFQEQWKAIGPVPQTESNNLWQNYHFYVEKFFDILRLNKEAREMDYKKNLESKLELCEKAESLLLVDSINQSFKDLQTLHEQWKEIGPVPEDKKEEVWERFKAASDQINQRRKEHYDKLFAEEQNNYNAKLVLCEQAEEITSQASDNVKSYNEISDKLADLLSMWKTLGPAPAKLNDEIWARFKGSLDKFFTQKKEYFQQIKDTQMQNYNQKLNLVIQAEGLADRTDWKQATADILSLQSEWKKIGATPRKYSDQIWKRFRAACDKFFAAKSEYFNNIQDKENENLQKKEDLIQKILNHEFSDDRAANIDVLKAYQNEWIEIGFVPKKDKDRIYSEYRAALDKRFAELKISAEDMKRTRYQSRIENILNNPNADKLIDKEKNFLRNKLAQLKEDIVLWENNLGFFANSKNAELITAEFRKKIDSAKEEVKNLEYKIRMMNNPKAKADDEAPAADAPAEEETPKTE